MAVPSALCPVYAIFLGALGIVFAISLCCIGAAIGTAKSGVGIAHMGVLRPELTMKCIIPVVMAGIVAIYGVVVSVLLSGRFNQENYSLYTGSLQLAAGLAVGLCSLAAGMAIGVVGDAGVRGIAQQPRLFIPMLFILIFAEVLGLYGLIVSIFVDGKANISTC